MSWLSVEFDRLKSIFTGLEAKNPSLAAPAQATGAALAAAETPAEELGVQLVNTAADAVLAFIPGGSNFDTLANGFIDEVIAALTAKKTTAAA
ncbi:MAG: hypothetical protein ACRED8_03890 [Caulobacteraceae bacterium]